MILRHLRIHTQASLVLVEITKAYSTQSPRLGGNCSSMQPLLDFRLPCLPCPVLLKITHQINDSALRSWPQLLLCASAKTGPSLIATSLGSECGHSMSQIWKLRPMEAPCPAQDHTVGMWPSWKLNPLAYTSPPASLLSF